jgi:hypothetical protein
MLKRVLVLYESSFYMNREKRFVQSPRENDILHTYHSRFILEGVEEVSQIFLRDTHVLPKLVNMNTADVKDGKPIAVLLQCISGVIAINPLVAFYDIHGGKREVLVFYYVPDTTRDETSKQCILDDFRHYSDYFKLNYYFICGPSLK